MAEASKPITDDDDEKELLTEHGHPNAVAPQAEATDEVKEEVAPVEEETTPTEPEAGGGDPDPAADGAVAGDAVLTEPAKIDPPPAQPGIDPYTAAKQDIDQKIAALRAKKKAFEIEPEEANEQINDLVMRRQDLVDEKISRQTAVAQYWASFHDEHGLTVKVGKELYDQAMKNMHAKGRFSEEAVLTEHDHLIELAKAKLGKEPPADKRQAVKPPTSAPLPKGNTKIAPPVVKTETVPERKEKSDEEELLETVRKIPGGIRG